MIRRLHPQMPDPIVWLFPFCLVALSKSGFVFELQSGFLRQRQFGKLTYVSLAPRNQFVTLYRPFGI
jgi:hypothetical protein